MAKKLTKYEKANWYTYKKIGCSAIHRCKVDQLNITIANSFEHELVKFKLFYKMRKMGHKILTEAEENKGGLQRDLVNLTTDEIYEIDNSKLKRGRRHPKNINVYWYNLGRWRTKEEAEEDAKTES